jgi:hypothetical protein
MIATGRRPLSSMTISQGDAVASTMSDATRRTTRLRASMRSAGLETLPTAVRGIASRMTISTGMEARSWHRSWQKAISSCVVVAAPFLSST